jgi:hypothetical protein
MTLPSEPLPHLRFEIIEAARILRLSPRDALRAHSRSADQGATPSIHHCG